MSSPARATRSQKRKESLDKAEEEKDVSIVADEESPSAEKSSKSLKKNSRELRRKQREGQRSRNLGVGLVISSETELTSSKHVVFDGEDANETHSVEEGVSEEQVQEVETMTHDMEGSDDDDDAVEEVKSNVARDQVMQQRSLERETAKLQKLQTHGKKRKKTSEADATTEQEEEEEFDDEFFAQVDDEMANKREQQRDGGKQKQTMGRHTTFVSTHEVDGPIRADHNIELVVLGEDETESFGQGFEEKRRVMEATMGTQPSEAAILFSRSGLVNGDDQPSKKRGRKEKSNVKRGKEQRWKRSKKMNLMASSRVRVHRRGGRGVAAVHFAKKR